jgi:hypothetical protein
MASYDSALESSLKEKMVAADEEKMKLGKKRKTGPGESDLSWWLKEDGAEKAGLLGWDDLSLVDFKNRYVLCIMYYVLCIYCHTHYVHTIYTLCIHTIIHTMYTLSYTLCIHTIILSYCQTIIL